MVEGVRIEPNRHIAMPVTTGAHLQAPGAGKIPRYLQEPLVTLCIDPNSEQC